MHPNHVRLIAVEPEYVKDLLDRDAAVLIDVRESDERQVEHIDGAIHMPLSQFDAEKIPDAQGRSVVVHCLAGARSSKAADMLFRSGQTDVMHMRGGLTAWKMAGLPTRRYGTLKLLS